VLVGTSSTGVPVYLRDLVSDLARIRDPTQYLNYLTYRDASGTWQPQPRDHPGRADALGGADRRLRQGGRRGHRRRAAQLPPDLIVERTSDQPRQVNELVSLLMGSLWEAIALVVIVALVGFWDWRAAMLMAASIPLTLALDLRDRPGDGHRHPAGLDRDPDHRARLLVDMPVVAGDAIKRELGQGSPRSLASWIGPSKLAKAIIFATITNIVAYLPVPAADRRHVLLPLQPAGRDERDAGRLGDRLVHLHAARRLLPDQAAEAGRGAHVRAAKARLRRFLLPRRRLRAPHRWAVFAGSLSILVVGWLFMSRLHPQFFPKDLSYLSYVDVWAPSDAPLAATNAIAHKAEP
jgi:hypothetical protein